MAASTPQRLSALHAALKRAGYDCGNLTYRKIWELAVERRYPAVQINARWHFCPEDTYAIAAALELPRITQEETEIAA